MPQLTRKTWSGGDRRWLGSTHALDNAKSVRPDPALFPASELRDALPAGIGAGDPIVPGHIPLTRADLDGADAVVFVADTDGTRHRYW